MAAAGAGEQETRSPGLNSIRINQGGGKEKNEAFNPNENKVKEKSPNKPMLLSLERRNILALQERPN